jgi:23S rRNA pseudouridine2457 synthase
MPRTPFGLRTSLLEFERGSTVNTLNENTGKISQVEYTSKPLHTATIMLPAFFKTARLLLLNKPFNVICQFSPHESYATLTDFVSEPDLYPAGRLDTDSEGLTLLTDNGRLQHRITDPEHKMPKTYWAQVEGLPTEEALQRLRSGVQLKDGLTRPADADYLAKHTPIDESGHPLSLWERTPPIRQRQNIPTTWIQLTLREGRNRQVRRMTAAVGYPTLRLIRVQVGEWSLDGLEPGKTRWINL